MEHVPMFDATREELLLAISLVLQLKVVNKIPMRDLLFVLALHSDEGRVEKHHPLVEDKVQACPERIAPVTPAAPAQLQG